MKMIKKIIVLFILLLPVLVTASTFSTERTNVNNYMTRSNFKNTYRRYIMNKDSNEDKGKLMFYMDDNGKLSDKANNKDINAGFTDGGFISKREYLLTVPEKGTSYLYDGSTYWTLTCNNESKKCSVIEYIGIINQSGMVEYLNNETNPNIRSKATEFVKKDTKVTGTGKKSDPWIFVPKYKVTIKVSDANKANIKYKNETKDSFDNIYLSGRCTGEGCSEAVELVLNEGYNYLSNDCDGSYNETTKKFTVSNISKDIVCTINVGTGKFKVTLGKETYDLKKDIYLRHKENFYSDSGYTDILYDIKSLNGGNLPERDGYKFLGYFISSPKTKIIDENGKVVDKVSVNKDKTLLVSDWENLKYKVTFNPNGGKIINGQSEVIETFDKKYENLPKAGKAGSSFEGWYTEVSGGSKVTSDTKVDKTHDHVLYAHYKACPKGTYNTGNVAACTSCPSGYTSVEGTTAENQCFMNVPAGKYLAAKASSATNCPSGQYRNGNVTKYYGESVSCNNCVTGSYSNAGASACIACQPSGASGTGGTTTGVGQSSCNAGCGKSNVKSWATTTWNSNNKMSNLCIINECKNKYKKDGNNCILNSVKVTINGTIYEITPGAKLPTPKNNSFDKWCPDYRNMCLNYHYDVGYYVYQYTVDSIKYYKKVADDKGPIKNVKKYTDSSGGWIGGAATVEMKYIKTYNWEWNYGCHTSCIGDDKKTIDKKQIIK